MSEASRQATERGANAHRAGRLDEALACYREALALQPDDAEALSLCGLALVHRGQPAEALQLLLRAVELEPQQVGFRLNLAEGLARVNERDRALHELRLVIAAEPGNARAWQRLNALSSEALVARRDWPALQAHAAAWTRSSPASQDAWRAAARAAYEQGRHVEACSAFAQILSLAQPTAVDLTAYAGLLLHALDIEAATVALEQAEALDPNYAPMLSNRALLLMYLGLFADAEAYCRRCLARDPAYAPAYTTLSRLRRGALADADLTAVTQLSQRQDVHLDYRISAAFAVAHAHDARDDGDSAFAAYENAHALSLQRDQQENRRYVAADVVARGQRIVELSAVPWPPHDTRAARTPRPIFIVGMPRSGTTLIESVLAAHTRVLACGERPAMQQLLRALLAAGEAGRSPDSRTLQEWSAAYFSDLRGLGQADHITDKHPLNFEAAGLIARLLPDAVIIHVRRNPVETGLSIFRQEFSKHWSFAHRLGDIGHYYTHYAHRVAHWERVLPGRITTIQYEEFVTDFARAAPALVAACGLGWESQCLDFQSTPRAIATFSTVEARGPVKLGNGRAQRYQKHLAPLLAALEQGGVNLDTGALAR